MINWKSIISAFDEKGTLLKWLQKVETALNSSVLSNATVNNVGSGKATITFNFEDGTDIVTPEFDLLAGPQGPQGEPGADGSVITAINPLPIIVQTDYTTTPIEIETTTGKYIVSIRAHNGEQGKEGAAGPAGRGITTIASGNPTTDPTKPGYTVTPVTPLYTDGSTPSSFNVYAKDGENGAPGEKGDKGDTGTPGQNGNGVVSITTIGSTQGTGAYEGYTATNINLDTDQETMPFIVYAKNGVDGTGGGVSENEFNTFKQSTETAIDNLNDKVDNLPATAGKNGGIQIICKTAIGYPINVITLSDIQFNIADSLTDGLILDINNGNLYRYTELDSLTNPTTATVSTDAITPIATFKGPKGDKGDTGAAGPVGTPTLSEWEYNISQSDTNRITIAYTVSNFLEQSNTRDYIIRLSRTTYRDEIGFNIIFSCKLLEPANLSNFDNLITTIINSYDGTDNAGNLEFIATGDYGDIDTENLQIVFMFSIDTASRDAYLTTIGKAET